MNLIAARMGCYQDHWDAGWAHLPTLGVHHVEINVPEPGEFNAIKQKLVDHNLSASSLQAACDIQRADTTESMTLALGACAELGAKVCFVSVHAGELPHEIVRKRLRAIGDEAAARGVTVCLETHPDLVHNGDVALETMTFVNHPNIRVNFDAANIYYYNHGCTTIGELNKIVDYVGSVHIKDSTGGYRKNEFPTIGKGIVDFPELFRVLGERGFGGPYTLELEGPEKRSEEEQFRHVADPSNTCGASGRLDRSFRVNPIRNHSGAYVI